MEFKNGENGGSPLLSAPSRSAETTDLENVADLAHAQNTTVEGEPGAGFMRQISASSGANSMEWTGLSLSIKDKIILDNVSGSASPGEICTMRVTQGNADGNYG